MFNKKKNNEITKQNEPRRKTFIPRVCYIQYTDKEKGEVIFPTTTDKLTFSTDSKNGINGKTILNIDAVEIIEPGDLEKASEHLSYVNEALNSKEYLELSVTSDESELYSFDRFISSLISMLNTALSEVQKHHSFIESQHIPTS